jgi:hypothetical protein
MTEVEVIVTPAEVEAANMIVELDKANGEETPEAIKKIANATVKPETVMGQVSIPTPRVTSSDENA